MGSAYPIHKANHSIESSELELISWNKVMKLPSPVYLSSSITFYG